MKVFLTKQTAEIDAYTIAHEPIRSIDLMERAIEAFLVADVTQINFHLMLKLILTDLKKRKMFRLKLLKIFLIFLKYQMMQ